MQEKAYYSHSPEGKHRIVYYEYGAGNPRTVICVHGLARFGRDFEYLANDLVSQGFRVIAPDMVGRGKSDRFDNADHYNYGQYINDIKYLYDNISVKDEVYWVGTSMGGILGMMMASQKSIPIKKMVINDIGPFIPASVFEYLQKYITLNPPHNSWDKFYASFKERMASFGIKEEEHYHFLAEISALRHTDGKISLNYDTGVVQGMVGAHGGIKDADLWDVWEKVACPVLVIRGGDSPVLSEETYARMISRSAVSGVTFDGVAHAPALMDEAQIKTVRDFLLRAE